MRIKTTCPICKGKKKVDYLVSVHNDETSSGLCHNCNGDGYVYEPNKNGNGNGDDYLFCYW